MTLVVLAITLAVAAVYVFWPLLVTPRPAPRGEPRGARLEEGP